MSWSLKVGDTDLAGAVLPRVRTSRGHDVGNTLTPRAGSLSATLAGEHDVLHAAVALQDGTDDVWTGEVREQSRDYDARTRELRTQLRASGPIAQIVAAGSGHGTNYYAKISVDAAIGHLLDAIGFPEGTRDIGASPRVLDYWWLDHNSSAWQALLTLVRVAGPQARLTERADGTLVFRDEAAAAAPDVASVWRDVGSGDGPVISRLSRDEAGLERVVNDVAIEYRSVGSPAPGRIASLVATGGSAVSITASEMQTAGIGADDLVIVIGIVTSAGGFSLSRPPTSALTYLLSATAALFKRFVGWRRGPATVSMSASSNTGSFIDYRLIAVAYRNADDPTRAASSFDSSPPAAGGPYALPTMTVSEHAYVLSTAVVAELYLLSNGLYSVQSGLTAPDGWGALPGSSLSADHLVVAGGDISGNEWELGEEVGPVLSRDVLILSVEIPAVREAVYEHDATLVISGDETLDVEARSAALFTAPITPVEDTDYGVDTGSLDSVSLLPRNFGDRATIRLVASASGATVSDLQLRAIPVPETTTEIATAADAASVTAYGSRQPRYQLWPYLDATEAQALADGTVAAGAEPRRSFTAGIDAGRNAATREAALGAELGDHVQVLLDGSFREGGELAAIRHEIGTGGTLRTEITIAGAGWVPFAPAGLTAQAGDGAVTLSWTDPADDGVTGYQYRVSDDGGSTWSGWADVDGADATTVSHTVTGLSNGTSYSFELRALGGGGADGATSVSATPPLKSAPSGLQATAGDGEVTLSWTDPSDTDLTGYQYRVSDDSGSTWSPDWTDIAGSDAATVSYTVTGLTNGTAYSFELRVLSAGGPGTAASISATPVAGP